MKVEPTRRGPDELRDSVQTAPNGWKEMEQAGAGWSEGLRRNTQLASNFPKIVKASGGLGTAC